jgi:hypothetical protein
MGTTTALVDTGDVHTVMIGAAGVGKTAYFLYPNLEYACASGMSFLTTDTKGDLFRNYAGVAVNHYDFDVTQPHAVGRFQHALSRQQVYGCLPQRYKKHPRPRESRAVREDNRKDNHISRRRRRIKLRAKPLLL